MDAFENTRIVPPAEALRSISARSSDAPVRARVSAFGWRGSMPESQVQSHSPACFGYDYWVSTSMTAAGVAGAVRFDRQ